MTVTIDPAPRMPGWGEEMLPFAAPRLDEQVGGAKAQGGRATLVLFFGTAAHPATQAALAQVQAHRALFDDVLASFYGITIDAGDAAAGRIAQQLPGIRFVLDYDRRISVDYDVMRADGEYTPCWVVLDRTLRVVGMFPVEAGSAAIATLQREMQAPAGPDWAPVVMVPNVFEPEFCRTLIAAHRDGDPRPSGVMRQIGAEARTVLDASTKVRRDLHIEHGPLADAVLARLVQRLAPMIRRAFQYDMQHVERLCIGCYDAAEGGHFTAHRDNTNRAAEHRQFAVTINLNAEDYDGGDLSFPEFGARSYRAPTGGAIVFSCGLLHAVSPVTRGRRYALLPFLFDAASDRIRRANEPYVNRDPLFVDPGPGAPSDVG